MGARAQARAGHAQQALDICCDVDVGRDVGIDIDMPICPWLPLSGSVGLGDSCSTRTRACVLLLTVLKYCITAVILLQ